ncbi:hypothetical protein [Phycicoccus jejuensis]|uniref:hypothetical protein n=1 Tax=Phycicoccus jejuensis TaxID=367299 RepID=UPI0004C3FC10|nr:hypothetical protein [Phycicoccus jejuensis]
MTTNSTLARPAPPAPRPRTPRTGTLLRSYGRPAAFVAAVLVLWWLLTSVTSSLPGYLVPSPGDMWERYAALVAPHLVAEAPQPV